MSIWLKNTPDEINISDAMKKISLYACSFQKSVTFAAYLKQRDKMNRFSFTYYFYYFYFSRVKAGVCM